MRINQTLCEAGKGSAPRPINDRKKFEEEYDRLFPPRKPKES